MMRWIGEWSSVSGKCEDLVPWDIPSVVKSRQLQRVRKGTATWRFPHIWQQGVSHFLQSSRATLRLVGEGRRLAHLFGTKYIIGHAGRSQSNTMWAVWPTLPDSLLYCWLWSSDTMWQIKALWRAHFLVRCPAGYRVNLFINEKSTLSRYTRCDFKQEEVLVSDVLALMVSVLSPLC